MREKPVSIGEIMDDWLKGKKFAGSPKLTPKGEDSEELQRQQIIFSCWEEAAGKRIARAVKPYKFERGTLYVCTESSSWAQEISFIKPELIRKINEKIGENLVANIRCRIGMPRESVKREQPQKGSMTPTPLELARIKLPKQVEQRVDEMVSPIQDDELRGLLRRVFSLHMKLKLWRERHGLKRCENCGEIYKSDEKECPICSAKMWQL